jgi:hypothetical protein
MITDKARRIVELVGTRTTAFAESRDADCMAADQELQRLYGTHGFLVASDFLELAEELESFTAWAEEHRAQSKRAGERPCIDAHRVARARRLLKRVGR